MHSVTVTLEQKDGTQIEHTWTDLDARAARGRANRCITHGVEINELERTVAYPVLCVREVVIKPALPTE